MYIKQCHDKTNNNITVQKGKAKYFGPYTSAAAVKEAIELIRRLYRIRNCNQKLPENIGKQRPCLYYHIHQCDAPCQGFISSEEYKKKIDKAIAFIGGDYGPILNELNEKMQNASEEMRFEEAASYRDLIDSVKRVSQSQKASMSPGDDWDIIALARKKEELHERSAWA